MKEQLERMILESGEPLLKYFRFAHLGSKETQVTSCQFAVLAIYIVEQIPRSAERTVCLRKLLEAKDAGVRAALENAA